MLISKYKECAAGCTLLGISYQQNVHYSDYECLALPLLFFHDTIPLKYLLY